MSEHYTPCPSLTPNQNGCIYWFYDNFSQFQLFCCYHVCLLSKSLPDCHFQNPLRCAGVFYTILQLHPVSLKISPSGRRRHQFTTVRHLAAVVGSILFPVTQHEIRRCSQATALLSTPNFICIFPDISRKFLCWQNPSLGIFENFGISDFRVGTLLTT